MFLKHICGWSEDHKGKDVLKIIILYVHYTYNFNTLHFTFLTDLIYYI